MVSRRHDIEEQLRKAILHSKISGYRLSQMSGVSEAVLSRFVRGERTINLTTAARLTSVLKLALVKDGVMEVRR